MNSSQLKDASYMIPPKEFPNSHCGDTAMAWLLSDHIEAAVDAEGLSCDIAGDTGS